jgi:hypothetical protein
MFLCLINPSVWINYHFSINARSTHEIASNCAQQNVYGQFKLTNIAENVASTSHLFSDVPPSSVNMNAAAYSETSLPIHQSTRRQIQKYWQLVNIKVQCRAVVNKAMNQYLSIPCTYPTPCSEIVGLYATRSLRCIHSNRRYWMYITKQLFTCLLGKTVFCHRVCLDSEGYKIIIHRFIRCFLRKQM